MIAAGVGLLIAKEWAFGAAAKSAKAVCLGVLGSAAFAVFFYVGFGNVGAQTNVILLGLMYLFGGVIVGSIPAFCAMWAHVRSQHPDNY